METQPNLRYRRIVRQDEAHKPLGHEPVLFKIHGSDEASSRIYQFVMTLDQESALPRWQNELLHQLVDNRVLLMAGYSGMDLDILPALGKCKRLWKHVRSVRPLEGLSKNSPHGYVEPPFILDEEKETLGIEGDLQEAFSRLYQESVNLSLKSSQGSWTSPSTRVAFALSSFPPEQRLLWLALIIIQSGAWTLGNRALEVIAGSDNAIKIAARATALFYAGKYCACANQWQALLNDRTANLSLVRKIEICGSTSDSLNCAGDFLGAWIMLSKAGGFLVKMLFSNQRDAWVNSFGQTLQRALVAVPFLSYLPSAHWFQKIFPELIRRMGALQGLQ